MEQHEVIKIELEGTNQRLANIINHQEVEKSFDDFYSKSVPKSKINRGWNGFDEVTTITGHGIGFSWSGVFMAVLAIGLLLSSPDPNAENIVFRDPTANTFMKWVIGIISLITVYILLFGQKKITIMQAGFYWHFLGNKKFVPWDGCRHFKVRSEQPEEEGIFFKTKPREYVSFYHEDQSIRIYSLSLPNVSPRVLAETMNKYRAQFLAGN